MHSIPACASVRVGVVSEMPDRENQGGGWRFKSLVVLAAIMVLAVVLAGTVSKRLSDQARAALAGTVCALGLIITVGLLVVLVRQYHDDS